MLLQPQSWNTIASLLWNRPSFTTTPNTYSSLDYSSQLFIFTVWNFFETVILNFDFNICFWLFAIGQVIVVIACYEHPCLSPHI